MFSVFSVNVERKIKREFQNKQKKLLKGSEGK